MTVASLTNKSGPYNGNGSTSAFAVNTKYTAKSEVAVIVTSSAGVETTKTLDTHYTLTDPGDTGTVTFITAPTDHRPQTGETVTIITTLALTQATDLTSGGGLTSNVLEGAYDKLTRLVQQIAEKVSRAPKLRQTTTTGEVLLPEPSAGAFLRWNSGATDLENGTTGGPGSGDVVGPASSTDNNLAAFDGTGGNLLKDSGISISNVLTEAEAAASYQPLDADLTAIAALSTASYGRSLLTLASSTALAAEVDSFFLTPTEGNAAYQPLDADLTAIAALVTTAIGRSLLAAADAPAIAEIVGVGVTDSPTIVNLTQTGFHDLTEIAAPSSPASNVARTYAVDDGAGVTTLTMKDSAGNVVPLSHFLQTGTGAVTRTQHAKQRDLLTVTDFGAVGDGVTDDTTAITAADAIAAAKFVPSGAYDTTLAAVDLDGPYWGRGQIRDNANQHRAPWFSAIKAAPASFGNHNSITTAFDGDLSKVQIAMEHRITGAATIGQPTTGYLYTPEASAFYGFFRNESGHNEELDSNVGRTAATCFRIKLHQVGQGDCVAYNASAFVNSTRVDSTDVIANPAASLFNGDMTAGQAGVYLNSGEFSITDAGFDCAAAGWVVNMSRSVATGAKDAFWFGFRSQSEGVADVNAHFSARGPCDVGLDFSGLNTDANLAAVALLADDRIYGNALNTNGRFATSLGNDYFTFSSSLDAWNFTTNAVDVLQIYSNRMTVQANLVVNHTAALAFGPSTTPRMQAVATDGNGIGSARYSNGVTGTSLFLAKSRGASIGTNTVVQSGDTLGLVRFCGADGTNFIDAAYIAGSVDGTPGANDMPGSLSFATTPDGSATPLERLRITSAGAVLASAPLGGIGYRTGAGGAQTQATSKSTTVVLNTVSGVLTLNGAILNANTGVTFTFTNSAIAAGDHIVWTHRSGGTIGAYAINAICGAGSATVTLRNITGGNLTETPVYGFAVIKGSDS